jgi:hypothetical protein
MKCSCVFWEFAKRKLAKRKDKDNKDKKRRLQNLLAARVVSQSWGEMRGACLLSRREDVSVFFGRANVHCEDLLDYWFH